MKLQRVILAIFTGMILLFVSCAPVEPGASEAILASTSENQFLPTTTSVPTVNNQPAKTSPVVSKTTSISTETPTIDIPAENSTPSTYTSVAVKTTQVGISPTDKPTRTLSPDEWKFFPIVPKISGKVVDIYHHGLELGNNPHAFSKIGDCGSTPTWFLGDFDRGPKFYDLGDYENLSAVIQEYSGSFGRTSLAARSGFNASSLLVPLWADRTFCESNEIPLACEYRNHKPVIAFIMLGANDVWHPDEFEPQMRRIIEYSIDNGVVPILSTKADNIEGNESINATITLLAREYEIPLWNYWLAIQALPNQGLQEDKVHLTWGRSFFNDSETMLKAWPVRNLTALQVLEAIWNKVNEQET